MNRTLVCPLVLCLAACGADPLNHIPGVNPWLDGNPIELASFAMDADEGYQAIAHRRTNALERTMLIAMRQDLASVG